MSKPSINVVNTRHFFFPETAPKRTPAINIDFGAIRPGYSVTITHKDPAELKRLYDNARGRIAHRKAADAEDWEAATVNSTTVALTRHA